MKLTAIPDLSTSEVTRVGHIRDYISKQEVRATPEEVDGTQVFSRRLVEDYGYPASHIRTRPQFKVSRSPSDEAGSYPVDIAVFSSDLQIDYNLQLIVECKQKNRRDGKKQLEKYMDLSRASIGVWFNGNEHLYIRKIVKSDKTTEYVQIPTIPKFRQRLEDIGLYKRGDLTPPSNLKAIFKDIRNHLAGNATGIARDEAFAQEIINLLFCKIIDEQDTAHDDIVEFRAGIDEAAKDVRARIELLFTKVKNKAFDEVFTASDELKLDDDSILYVVGELQSYCIMDADRDAIGDAFEVFIGPALRGSEGQFFTPRNVVKMMVDMLNPRPDEKVIDPSCGSGGFLIAALEHVWGVLKEESYKKRWTARRLYERETQVATGLL